MVFLTEYGHLVVDDFGGFLGKKYGRIVYVNRGVKEEFPVKRVRDVVVLGDVSVSSDLIRFLSSSGVSVLFATATGRPLARVVGVRVGGSSANRLAQFRAQGSEAGVVFAKSMVAGKIANMVSNLKYYSKARRASPEVSEKLYGYAERLKALLDELEALRLGSLEEARPAILSVEGRASALYWEGMAHELGEWGFKERLQRFDIEKGGEPDPANLCLNVAYNLLSGQVWRHVLLYGLDPYMGFLHVERPGRVSLVFDLMEPFRPIVDRWVVGSLRSRRLSDFAEQRRSQTVAELRREFYRGFMQDKMEYKSRRITMEAVMFYYVQDVVSFLRGSKTTVSTPYLPW